MKDRISALMDGELGRHESSGALQAVQTGDEARDSWRTYHLIGDALRDTRQLSLGFADRVIAKLAEEPTVLAPARFGLTRRPMRWSALAASLAAAAFVGWVAFAPQEGQVPASPVAQSTPAPAVMEATFVAPPDTAHDYLLAHQGYSPLNSLQGVAPYVRTVSGDAGAQRR